jgi:hypothetical protein
VISGHQDGTGGVAVRRRGEHEQHPVLDPRAGFARANLDTGNLDGIAMSSMSPANGRNGTSKRPPVVGPSAFGAEEPPALSIHAPRMTVTAARTQQERHIIWPPVVMMPLGHQGGGVTVRNIDGPIP